MPDKKYEVNITRVFDAPRELVWKMWTNPEMYKKWWGPTQYSCPEVKIDFKVGGKFIGCMQGPDGNRSWSTGTYKEIIPMEKIVTSDSFSDENGNIVGAEVYGLPADFPREMQVTITFADENGKTKMTLRHEGVPSQAMVDDMTTGWSQSLDKMDAELK